MAIFIVIIFRVVLPVTCNTCSKFCELNAKQLYLLLYNSTPAQNGDCTVIDISHSSFGPSIFVRSINLTLMKDFLQTLLVCSTHQGNVLNPFRHCASSRSWSHIKVKDID